MYAYLAAMIPGANGRYDILFPDLPGCVSYGENLSEAARMAHEALSLHLRGMLADNDSLPAPSASPAEAEAHDWVGPLPAGTVWQYVVVDIPPPPARKEEPVKLTVSVRPTVLRGIDAAAEEMGISRSALFVLAAREYIRNQRG